MLAGHQAVLAPVSSVLRDMFQLHSVSHIRNMIYISIDCDPKVIYSSKSRCPPQPQVLSLHELTNGTDGEKLVLQIQTSLNIFKCLNLQVLQSILCLIYNGKTYLSTTAVEKMKSIVKMLDLKFPGGFDRSILAKGSVPPTTQLFQVSDSVVEKPNGLKRAHESRSPSVSSAAKKTRVESRGSCAPATRVVSATERMNVHVSMTLELKDAAPGTSVKCKMPDCGAEVTYDQLSNHFLAHETSASTDNTSSSPGENYQPITAQ